MNSKEFKPNIFSMWRDVAVVAALISASILINSGISVRSVSISTAVIVFFSAVYIGMLGTLPRLKIRDNGTVEYRSDYGVAVHIEPSSVRKITMGSGLGGLERAIFVTYTQSKGSTRTTKIKTGYFDKQDLKEIVHHIGSAEGVEVSSDLQDFLDDASRRTANS